MITEGSLRSEAKPSDVIARGNYLLANVVTYTILISHQMQGWKKNFFLNKKKRFFKFKTCFFSFKQMTKFTRKIMFLGQNQYLQPMLSLEGKTG